MNLQLEIPKRPVRKFLPEDFKITTWDELKTYFNDLLKTDLGSSEVLELWLKNRSELESVIAEDMGWRYIRMTCFTENEEYRKAYEDFVQNIQPHMSPLSDQLNKKLIGCPFLTGLESKPGYNMMIRNIRKEIELFRESNIPLFTEINLLTQKYGQITGAMMVEIDGKEMTMQQAGVIMMSPDRKKREEVFRKITARRQQDKNQLDELFSRLIQLRHQVATNADFANFRDFMFKSYGRFDYSPEDCFQFHDAVKSEVVPLVSKIAVERKEKLNIPSLRPWDKLVDPEGREPLKAFGDGKELTSKAIEVFNRLDPYLGQCLSIMNEMGHLDLESRKGKAPGGYNYPLAEIGVPFIFMNATSTLRDMTTIMHEGGHAVHNFLTMDLPLSDFKSPPMEVAELASMSMELISMDHWDIFFTNADELKRAKLEHLEDLIETLPWVATIDKYQHWLYENPQHSAVERKEHWNEIMDTFSDDVTDWGGLQEGKDFMWQKQLHLYEVPFYYIEYGMAQLGAIAVWRNYRKEPQAGLQGYMNALKLGYTKTIPEIYAAANIRFDFSREYIKELMSFVKEEIQKI